MSTNRSKYGPTPPMIIRSASGDGDESLVAPGGGVLKTLTSEVEEMMVTDEAGPHDLCEYEVHEDRTFQIAVYVEGYDEVGGRSFSGASLQQVARYGAAPIAVPYPVGTPVLLQCITPSTYPASAAPWTTPAPLHADLVVLAGGEKVAVRCSSIAGTTIRWRVTLKIVGAQAQIVTM